MKNKNGYIDDEYVSESTCEDIDFFEDEEDNEFCTCGCGHLKKDCDETCACHSKEEGHNKEKNCCEHSHNHCDCGCEDEEESCNCNHHHSHEHSHEKCVHGHHEKACILYDDRPNCIHCGECEMCDLDPNKVCDNCGKCLEEYGLPMDEKGFYNFEAVLDKDSMSLEDMYTAYGLEDEEDSGNK